MPTPTHTLAHVRTFLTRAGRDHTRGPHSSYEGEWSAGLPHGRGTMRFNDGRCYTGEYSEGRKHGMGTFVFCSGRTWTGTFVHGKQGQAMET